MKNCEDCGVEFDATKLHALAVVLCVNCTEERDRQADAEEAEDESDGEPRGSFDGTDDEEALASAGHGMDESYMGGLDSDLMDER